MKKSCQGSLHHMPSKDRIVRPSRLTKILKNKSNIDKTKSLKFRYIQLPIEPSTSYEQQQSQYDYSCSSGCKIYLTKEKGKKSECESKDENTNIENCIKLASKNKYKQLLDKWESQEIVLEKHNSRIKGSNSVCGVCTSKVFYKSIQQNRKYGITACKFCKIFISMMSKKAIAASRSLSKKFKIQCIEKKGDCSITSLPTNIVKCFKQIYDERCSACWLRKCIQSFHFPIGHKLRLRTIISEVYNRETKPVYQSQETLDSKNVIKKCIIASQSNVFSWNQNIPANYTKEGVQQKEKPALHTSNIEIFMNSSKSAFEPCFEDSCSNSFNTKLEFCFNDNLHRVPSDNIEFQNNSIYTADNLKRQKIALKGPRVKHVCRSASIALGQQIATFLNDPGETVQLLQSKSEIESCSSNHWIKGNNFFFENNKENKSQGSIKDVQQINVKLERQIKCKSSSLFIDEKHDLNDLQKNYQKKEHKCDGIRNLFSQAYSSSLLRTKQNLIHLTNNFGRCEQASKMISIDFWTTFVPTEVNQTGFGLILTKPASVFALCFLCGSMDLKHLLFCVSCCEPYHSYCIKDGLIIGTEFFDEKEASSKIPNQMKWICPRCTVCNTCNMSSGAKIECQKCKKNYHNTCMGSSKGLLGADRPLICRSCLKCQFCPTKNVSKYIGNQPTCIQCFKQKLSISNCPICQECVDIVLDLIILECGLCNEFVHAKCEGLIEEQSYLLSNIAASIKYVCNKCCVANDQAKLLANKWREAVYKELKYRLLKVLKLLSESPLADILKNCNTIVCHTSLFSNSNKNEISRKDTKEPNMYGIPKKISSKSNSARQIAYSLSLLDIKKKIINEEYVSLFDFNADINKVIIPLKNDDLVLTYKEIISEQFSWFQNETKTCTDALEEDMIDSCTYSLQIENNLVEDQASVKKLPLPGSEEKVFTTINCHVDKRNCIFCLKEGDDGILQESRLLYYGFDSWVHANCALLSIGVYEEFDGSLQNVHGTYSRGRRIRCVICKCFGATIKCNVETCCSYYHFQCGRKSGCLFKYESSMFCPLHKANNITTNSHLSNEILSLSRPLHIECNKSHKKFVEPFNVQFMIGALCVVNLGNVIPPFSDTLEAIIPINFICTRLYWSSKEPWKVIKYKVQTSIQNSSITDNYDCNTHFTVDHSKSIIAVERDLSKISCWHSTLAQRSSTSLEGNKYDHFKNFGSPNVFGYRHVTSSEEFFKEEHQNNSDLLPPEIEEAILRDLPNNVFNEISVLDIFPKLMIHEDLREGKLDKSIDTADNFASQQPIDLLINSITKQDSKTNLQKCDLQCSSSETVIRNLKCYDKKRYFTKDIHGSNLYEQRAPLCNRSKEKVRDFKWNFGECLFLDKSRKLEEFKKDDSKLMQLDGAEDLIGVFFEEQKRISEMPFECDRCQCHYRTLNSFRRHFLNCEQTSTREIEAETLQSQNFLNSVVSIKNDSNENNIVLNHNQLLMNQNAASIALSASNENSFESEAIITQNIGNIDSLYANVNKTISSTITDSLNIDCGNSLNLTNINFDNNQICINDITKSDQCKLFTKFKQDTVGAYHKVHKTGQYPYDNPNNFQILNQNISYTNQYSKKEEQLQQQQLEYYHQIKAENQPMLIQQAPSAVSTIPENVFPTQNASIPALTTSIVPIWLSDCNLMLTSGLQIMPMPSLPVATPLVSYFNLSQIGSNQVFLGEAHPVGVMQNSYQYLLAPQPIYYNLERIVQNTIMSSQQFVSTAMQGILSQNSSFSATTTQVFQSNKFEPVTNVPSSYVSSSNIDGTILFLPEQNFLSEVITTNSAYGLQNANNSDVITFNGANPQKIIQKAELNNMIPLLLTLPELTNASVDTPVNTFEGTKVFEKSSCAKPPVESTTLVENRAESKTKNLSKNWILTPPFCSIDTINESNISNKTEDIANDLNLHNLSEMDIFEMRNTTFSFIETSEQNNSPFISKTVNRKKRSLKPHQIEIMDKNSFPKEFKLDQPKDVIFQSLSKKTVVNTKLLVESSLKDNSVSLLSHGPKINDKDAPSKVAFESFKNECEIPELKVLESTQSIINRSTKTKSNDLCVKKVPTNRVEPIMQAKHSQKTTSRPTNRVLPMQSIHKAAEKAKLKYSICSRYLISENVKNQAPLEVKLLKTIPTTLNGFEYIKPMRKRIETEKKLIDFSKDISDFLDNFEEKKIKTHITNSCLLELTQKQSLSSCTNSLQTTVNKSKKNGFSDEDTNNRTKKCNTYVPPEKKIFEKQPIFLGKDVCNINSKKKSVQSDILQIELENHKTNLKCFPSSLTKSLNQFKPEPKQSTGSYIIYEVQSEDGFRYKSESIADAWLKVFETVQSSRRAHGLPFYPTGPFADICGAQILGLKTNALKYLIEQLPGTEKCRKYIPKYHKNAENSSPAYMKLDLHEHIFGPARCEPFVKRSAPDMFSWLASKHRKQPKQIFVQPSDSKLIARRCTGNLPMAMKYRTLKETCKLNVSVFWSVIHGRGLFCIKDIEAGEMVIEYAGELIRSTLADKRERFYDSRGIGCYMFKIDEYVVVDATMRGNAARFINHSCEPNCYSKVVDILGHKHIIIFSQRRIVQGEELTYDYKFSFEDVKIHCYCTSKKCRKYLN